MIICFVKREVFRYFGVGIKISRIKISRFNLDINAFHYADFFDDERYAWLGWQKYAKFTDYDKVVALADRVFKSLNYGKKTRSEWTEWEDGWDVRIYDSNHKCVYKAHEKLPE